MASKNRTEIKSDINTVFVPTLAIVDHRTFLNEQADNLLFGKDVKQTFTVVSGSTTLDFAGKDTFVVDAATYGLATTFTLSNLEDGNVKYLVVNKNAGQTIGFANIDLTEYPTRILGLTQLIYTVYNKNNIVYVKLLSETVNQFDSWQNTTIYGEASTGSYYRIDEFGYLEVRVEFRNTTPRALGLPLFILPAAYRPVNWNFNMSTNVANFASGGMLEGVVSVFYSTGEVILYQVSKASPYPTIGVMASTDINFYFRIPLSIF